jgi:hypothetical protein
MGQIAEAGSPLRYELAGRALSLDALILLYVAENPGCSANKVRKDVPGRNAEKDEMIRTLISRGALEDRGSKQSGMALFVTSEAENAGRTSGRTSGEPSSPAGNP